MKYINFGKICLRYRVVTALGYISDPWEALRQHWVQRGTHCQVLASKMNSKSTEGQSTPREWSFKHFNFHVYSFRFLFVRKGKMRLKILKFILFSRLVLCVMLQTLALLLQDCLTLNANIMACWPCCCLWIHWFRDLSSLFEVKEICSPFVGFVDFIGDSRRFSAVLTSSSKWGFFCSSSRKTV